MVAVCVSQLLLLVWSVCLLMGPDQTRQDKTRQDKTRQDKTRQDQTRQDKTKDDPCQATRIKSEVGLEPPSRFHPQHFKGRGGGG